MTLSRLNLSGRRLPFGRLRAPSLSRGGLPWLEVDGDLQAPSRTRPEVAFHLRQARRPGATLALLALCILLGSAEIFAANASGDAAKTRELVAVLQSGADVAARARACQQLAIVGTKDAVPALAALLPHPQLGEYARDALEVMPDESAGEALRAALNTLQGDVLVGVINSVGIRRDAKAVDALLPLTSDRSPAVAAAAMLALGRIGAPSARLLQRLLATVPEPLRAAAAEACLVCADRMLEQRARASALFLYQDVRMANVPRPLRVTAAHGVMLATGASSLPLLLELLRGDDVEMRNIALRAARELPGRGITAALVAELPKLKIATQPLLIAALVDRGDARALPAIEASASSNDDAVRTAALNALGKIGGNSSVPILLRAATGADADVALASLGRVPARETDAAILRALPDAPPPVRARLIAVLGERNAVAAIPELMKLAAASDSDTQQAALRALGVLGRPAELSALIQIAISARDEELKVLADRAVATTSMKVLEVEQRDDAVLAALRAAPDAATKRALLRPLGAIVRSMGGSADAFTTVEALLRDGDDKVRDAALQCLADWPDAAPATVLLELLASNPPAAQHDIALRGALRMAASVAAGRDHSPIDATAAFQRASRFVQSRSDKLLFVSSVGELRRGEALSLLQPYLEDPEVRTEAALALVQVAPALLNSSRAADTRAALEKIAATETDEELRRRAARLAKGIVPPPAGKKKAAPRK